MPKQIDEFIKDLTDIHEELWGYDIPSSTVPEYREHHEQIQTLMRYVKGKIKKWDEKRGNKWKDN